MSYEATALKEGEEETGIKIDPTKLKLVKKMRRKDFDEATGLINNTIRSQYVYLFNGDVKELRVEEGKAVGFEIWKIDSLPTLSNEDKKRFIPMYLSKEFLELFDEGQKLLGLKIGK
jgi:8-oxo-dGTP pyrophosphatase MutT (NUDIX family)